MQLLLFAIFILFSLEWNFSYSLTVLVAGDPTTNSIPENNLKGYLRRIHNKPKIPKIHFKWLKREYREEKKARLNACKRTRGEKLHLCRVVLGSDEYHNLKIDGSRPNPPDCKKRKFEFANLPPLPASEGKQKLPMYPCITTQNPQQWYYLSDTGEKMPSLYLFYQSPEKNAEGEHPIYFAAEITGIDMKKLWEAREKEAKIQHNMFLDGPIATVHEHTEQGGLIPSEIV